MKKFVCCIMLFLMVASFCFAPRIYARANTINSTEIEENHAQYNSGTSEESNVVQDLEIEDIDEII